VPSTICPPRITMSCTASPPISLYAIRDPPPGAVNAAPTSARAALTLADAIPTMRELVTA
jgi:hypothetical protein